MMATFDELRASRDRLERQIEAMEKWLVKARILLVAANYKIAYSERVSPEIGLLLEELNRELKRDNDEAEAKNVQGR